VRDSQDRELGMDRPITRRDFLNGVALTLGAAIVPSPLFAALDSSTPSNYYPPAQTGLRGSHVGSGVCAYPAPTILAILETNMIISGISSESQVAPSHSLSLSFVTPQALASPIRKRYEAKHLTSHRVAPDWEYRLGLLLENCLGRFCVISCR